MINVYDFDSNYNKQYVKKEDKLEKLKFPGLKPFKCMHCTVCLSTTYFCHPIT